MDGGHHSAFSACVGGLLEAKINKSINITVLAVLDVVRDYVCCLRLGEGRCGYGRVMCSELVVEVMLVLFSGH